MKIQDMQLGNTYVLWGDSVLVNNLAKKLGSKAVFNFEILGVDETRELRERLVLSSDGGGNAWTIICAKGMTENSQNAFLKSIEELDNKRGIVFVLPRSVLLLATFLSRVIIVADKGTLGHSKSAIAKEFMAMSIGERVSFARLEENQDPDILDALEEYCHKEAPIEARDKLRNILYIKNTFRDDAITAKMALEHLAYII